MPNLKDPGQNVITDPGQIEFDPTSQKDFDPTIYGPKGEVLSDTIAKRKELIGDLLSTMQNTLHGNLSGLMYSSKIDEIGTYLYSLEAYANSLNNAVNTIMVEHPVNDYGTSLLKEVSDLCEALLEGSRRVKEYISAVNSFSGDIERIRDELYTKMKTLYLEF
jgi:hypothetical protein